MSIQSVRIGLSSASNIDIHLTDASDADVDALTLLSLLHCLMLMVIVVKADESCRDPCRNPTGLIQDPSSHCLKLRFFLSNRRASFKKLLESGQRLLGTLLNIFFRILRILQGSLQEFYWIDIDSRSFKLLSKAEIF